MAKRYAAQAVARLLAGKDVSFERASLRSGSEAGQLGSEATVAEVAAKYMKEYVAVRCKPGTVQLRESLLRLHVLPAIGHLPLARVSRGEVAELHRRLAATPETANSAVATLSCIFNMAALWEIVPEGANPCRRLPRYKQRKRERFLTEAEYRRFGRVLDEALAAGDANPTAIAAIRLLMLTGCRKGEILSLRWSDVDIESRELKLRDAKTGPRVVPLSPAAASVLAALPRSADCKWVLPGRKPGSHLTSPTYVWNRLRARARLTDVRLHDLRHSFASTALALGESLPMIARLLGHKQIATTARYAHLARGAVHEAAERVAASLASDIL